MPVRINDGTDWTDAAGGDGGGGGGGGGTVDAASIAAAGGQLTVKWSGSAWPARPTDVSWGVLFLSTNDADATAPDDVNLEAGDVWQRHPDAED